MVESNLTDDVRTISLLPNRSASWAETRLLILLLCGTCLIIGVFWTMVGAWMVLPFSGLEAGLAAWLLYRVSRQTYKRQVISVKPDTVLVQFGYQFPTRSWELSRAQTCLSVTEPEHHLDSIQLNIFDHRHSLKLGEFLNADDTEVALRELKASGLRVYQHRQPEQSSF